MNWQLYDDLIAPISSDILITQAVEGFSWSAVATEHSVGVSMRMGDSTRPALAVSLADGAPPHVYGADTSLAGMRLRDLALCAKSWNMREASLGVAAINAFYNAAVNTTVNTAPYVSQTPHAAVDPFVRYQEKIAGKKVAAIGHFPDLETRIAPFCELTIFEKNPRQGDYPHEAEEYLLPEQHVVFITGSTLANKTLPRMLELCANAFVILVGPSTPMAPLLFEYGVSVLSGLYFPEPARCLSAIQEQGHHHCIRSGVKIFAEK